DESLSSGSGLHSLLKREDPKSFFGLHGGGIGWALPGALGVKLALKDRPVVALIGDGGVMYTNQALWTAAHYNLGVVVVIINNLGYRILKQRTYALKGISAQTGRYVGMDLDIPRIDFIRMAQALGVPGERVEKAAEIGPALLRALARGGPNLIDVAVDGAFLPQDGR
ncbi:MAG TPA: thiamine pyrophosphate-dependent enzyme, partial [Candidatus Methylomirabilis sp.]|nr:thiamine pyrophosphate-dependent enzyme [Candidatus Methylomirabilis sp.]